jgi:hypothetical protein
MLVRSLRLQLRNIDPLRGNLAASVSRESNISSGKYFRGRQRATIGVGGAVKVEALEGLDLRVGELSEVFWFEWLGS